MMWNAFPDLSVEVLDFVAEADRVVVRYVDTGTHLGELLGVPRRLSLCFICCCARPRRRIPSILPSGLCSPSLLAG
jgi:hypothetical protein